MKILLNEVLASRDKTLYWLSKETGSTWGTLQRLANNDTESIKFSVLDNICKALECKISDIMQSDHESNQN